MIDFTNLGITSKIIDFVAAGALSTFGGVAAFLYNMSKHDKPFSWASFLISAFLAFFIGNVIGSFIPVNMAYRDGLLMVSGFSSYSILELLQLYGKRLFIKLVEKQSGIKIIEDSDKPKRGK